MGSGNLTNNTAQETNTLSGEVGTTIEFWTLCVCFFALAIYLPFISPYTVGASDGPFGFMVNKGLFGITYLGWMVIGILALSFMCFRDTSSKAKE